jgi:hypothetical protein
MPKFPDISPLEYCESNGLRILASEAFKFFYEELENTTGNYLEIGTFEGYMLRELARLYPQKMLYGIDPFIEDGNTTGHNDGVQKGEFMYKQCEITNANVVGIPNIKFFCETSREWSKRQTCGDYKRMGVTAVFVDGDHSYEEATNDLAIATCLLSDGGVIYVDDAGLPTVNQALVEFGFKTEYRNGGAIIRI